jgi:hypothetical protein
LNIIHLDLKPLIKKKKTLYLGGDATDVEARAAEGATLLNTSGFEAELSGFDSRHVTPGPTADDDDVVFVRSRSESSIEGSDRRMIVFRQKGSLPSR